MPLKRDMTPQEAKEFLQRDLKQSIKNDIYPILQPEKEEGGYFGAACLVLCYLDFLGALYGGYPKNDKFPRGRKKIATQQKTVGFIKDILGSVDCRYKHNADLLYEMYRHGTVHLYAPKVLKKNGRELRWLLYKGEREKREMADRRALKVQHMQPIERDDESDWLPVSINCLYDDLRTAIDEFCALLDADKNARVEKWREAADALCEPEETLWDWSTEHSVTPPGARQRA
jgi:rRNA processing protein Gar1